MISSSLHPKREEEGGSEEDDDENEKRGVESMEESSKTDGQGHGQRQTSYIHSVVVAVEADTLSRRSVRRKTTSICKRHAVGTETSGNKRRNRGEN